MVRLKPIATLKSQTVSIKLICGTNREMRFEKSYPNDDIGMNQNFHKPSPVIRPSCRIAE